MLFRSAVLERIGRGEVTLALRRWRRPTVRAGTRLRTPVGTLPVIRVEEIEERDLGEDDARAAGYPDLAAALDDLRCGEGRVYRIALGIVEPDERIAKRATAALSEAEAGELVARLKRCDGRAPGRGLAILQAIADRPATRAADLAALFGLETTVFKREVRKLKDLGLTESLDVGYRLSPFGRAALKSMSSAASG